MNEDLWLNLPVKDVAKSREFFTKLGFSFDTQYGEGPHSAGLVVGKKRTIVMLFEEAQFKSFTNKDIPDTRHASEVLFSLGAESREAVDEIARLAVAAGGTSEHQPSEMQGWLYGCLFADLDGHRWNALYMDMSKMPKG